MPAESPAEILREQNPEALPAEQPPEAANYRPADVEGVACQFCSKFQATGYEGEGEEQIAVGYCDQWEANVRGDHVSDAFADPGPPLDEAGNEQWDFADSDRAFAEIHLSGADTTEEEKSGFVVKEVLRTGEWPAIPTRGGVIPKPLRIIREGKSSKDDGTISLAELVENFKAGALPAVQIPLSDDADDHKNITRTNTGFVRDLWIEGEGEEAKLVAKMEFTEPDVKEKVLRGTYADVSCGIPWKVRSRGKEWGTCLEHVAITNRPFIDGLGPFFAASDKQPVDVDHFGDIEQPPPETEHQEEKIEMSFKQKIDRATEAISAQLKLSTQDYEAFDIAGSAVKIRHAYAGTTWSVPFEVDGEGNLSLAAIENWAVEEGGEKSEPSARKGGSPRSLDDGLEEARCLRELRLSAQPTTKRAKEGAMPLTREELDRLELSDEARAAVLSVLDENASLRASTREQEADRRVAELEELGLKDRPGALRFYREVMLSDDGGPAVVLLSDSGQKESLTALTVLDRFIEGVKGADGKVVLSDQHLASGNDDPPPANTDGETKTVEERTAAARAELYGKRTKK